MPRRKRGAQLDPSTKVAAINMRGNLSLEPADIKLRFLKELRVHGIVAKAVEASGGSLTTIYRWRKEDPDFAQLWEQTHAYAMGEYEDVVRHVAHHAFYDRDKLAAATFMLRHQDARFRDQEKAGGQTVIVNIKVPSPAAPASIPKLDPADLAEFQQLPAAASGPVTDDRGAHGAPTGADQLPAGQLQPGSVGFPSWLQPPLEPGRQLESFIRGADAERGRESQGDRDDGPDRDVDWSALIPEGQFRELIEE